MHLIQGVVIWVWVRFVRRPPVVVVCWTGLAGIDRLSFYEADLRFYAGNASTELSRKVAPVVIKKVSIPGSINKSHLLAC